MKISVVIPVYDEVATIEEILSRVQPVELEKEIIIVDDGSTDGTHELLNEIGHAQENLKVLFHRHNQGKGAALRTGFGAVTGDIIIIQDADLEYDPREYKKLLEPILDGRADVVFGSRFLGGPHRVLFFWHYVGILIILLGISRNKKFKNSINIILLILLFMLVGYFMVYITTPHSLEYHLDTSLRRLFLQLLPSAFFVFFLSVSTPEELLRKEKRHAVDL